MLKLVHKLFAKDLAVDLGTTNTKICSKGYGVVLAEPSVVAIKHSKSSENKIIAAVGKRAKTMWGRTPENITTMKPLKDGVVADYQVTEKMLQFFFKQVHNNSFFKLKPRVLIAVPHGATSLEKKAVEEAAYEAGACEVLLIDKSIAAALGANIATDATHGAMVVDIGGGSTEIGVIALNGKVYANSIRIGGDALDMATINHVRRNHGIVIGEVAAEKLKKDIGIAKKTINCKSASVLGRSVIDGKAKEVTIDANELVAAYEQQLWQIIDAIRVGIESVPPEIGADILSNGIILTGGSAKMPQLSQLISEEINLPVIVAENYDDCTALGCSKAFSMVDNKVNNLFLN